MKIGYMRITKAGTPEIEQREALIAAGVVDLGREGGIYVDREPKRVKAGADPSLRRTFALKALRPGDVLVVESAARLGATRAEVLKVMREVRAAEASILDTSAGELVRWHPDAMAAIAMTERAESQAQRERAAKARRGKAALGLPVGPPPALAGKQLDLTKKAWADQALSADEVATQFGVAVRTLYRRFGPKGTPLFEGKKGP